MMREYCISLYLWYNVYIRFHRNIREFVDKRDMRRCKTIRLTYIYLAKQVQVLRYSLRAHRSTTIEAQANEPRIKCETRFSQSG